MKKKIVGIFVMTLLIAASMALTGTVLADWDEGDCHKMHYPQLPKEGGWDVWFPSRLADDWKCSESGPVEDIHFWISWEKDDVQPIEWFSITIWSDDPNPGGYSKPKDDLWYRDFYTGDFIVRYMEPDLQGWFDPHSGLYSQNDHTTWAQINIVDIEDPFIQEEGTIYWLEIDPGYVNWGWKESGSEHFQDNAVYWWGYDWFEVRDPITHEGLDLAFVITGGNDPPGTPTITGETNGKVGTSYTYTFTSTDPNGDQVSYYIDWGDGTTPAWSAFQASGAAYSASHTWTATGGYTITAKAKDICGAEGPEGTLTVTMPRDRAINTPFLNFLENHPNLFPILRLLLQRAGL